jgi:hypothetical protein
MNALTDLLQSMLAKRLEQGSRTWLDSALAAAAGGDSTASPYTVAAKRLGRAVLTLDDDERRALATAAPGIVFDRWTLADAGRALLLSTLARALPDGAFVEAATEWYELGDSGEQQSWLRALPLLPGAERFRALAIDACRTNIVPLFESIACDNPYPERYFPTAQFNQLVLKAMFVGLPLAGPADGKFYTLSVRPLLPDDTK